jgi:hypothetical protein
VEVRDRFLGSSLYWILTSDESQFGSRRLDALLVLERFSNSTVDDDLLQLGEAHGILDAELLSQLGKDLIFVFLLQS